MRIRSLLLGFYLLCTVSAWSQERPQMILQKGHSSNSEVVAVSQLAERDLVATAATDGQVKIWNLSRSQVIRSIYDQSESVDPSSSKSLKSACFAPDGSWVVTCDSESKFRRFSLPDGKLLSKFELQDGYRISAFVTDGKSLYMGLGNRLLKTDLDGKVVGSTELTDSIDYNALVALSVDGQSIAVPARNGVALLSTDSFQELGFLALNYPLQGLTFSPNGQELVVSTQSAVAALSLPTLSVNKLVEKSQDLGAQRTIPVWMGEELALIGYRAGRDLPIHRVDFASKALRPVGKSIWVESLKTLPDGRVLVGSYGGSSKLLALGLEDFEELPADIGGYTALALHPMSHDFFTASRSGEVLRWSSRSGQNDQEYKGLDGWVSGLCVSPDGSKLLGGDYHRGDVICWDTKSGNVVSRVNRLGRGQFATGVQVLKFVDDSRFFVATEAKRGLALYEAAGGTLVETWELPRTASVVISNSSSGRFAVGYHGGVMEGSLTSKRDVLSTQVGRTNVTALTYAGDGKSLFLGTDDGRIMKWDYSDPKNKPVEIQGYYGRSAISSLKTVPEGLEFITRRGELRVLSLSGKILKEVQLQSDYVGNVAELAKDRSIAQGSNLSIVFLDDQNGDLLGRLMGVRDNVGWVAMERSGDFDGNDKGLATMTFQLGGQLYGVDQFMNEHFRPGVLARLIPKSGEAETRRTGPELTSSSVKVPPKVEILEPQSGTINDSDTISVKVKVTDQGAGVANVGLLHNGHRLPDSVATKVDAQTFLFKVRPVKGKNEFRATAFDGTRSVEARQDRVRVLAPNVESRPPRLHLLSVGIDKYASGLSLRFAEDDATSVSKLFQSTVYQPGKRLQISNEKATLQAIKEAISTISAEAEPQDAFVLYLAGHGTVVGESYFFLPYDVKIDTDESLAASALSSEQLALALRDVPATKQLLVLDSCRSGAAVGVVGRYFAARAGLEEVRSQQLLARASGTFLIAATKGEEYAYEIPELGHGVLTYAILESLGMTKPEGAKTVQNPDGVSANDLVRAVSGRVPELSEKYQGVRQQVIQYSSGQDFLLAK